MLSNELINKLSLLNLRTKRSFLGKRQGVHRSLKRGHGIEFSDYREYQLGDNPKNIDWALYGRSDRIYVKTYQEEQNLSILISCDASSSMGLQKNEKNNFTSKWDAVTELVLSLSYIAFLSQDEVTIHGMNSFFMPRLQSLKNIRNIEKTLQVAKEADQKDTLKDLKRVVQDTKYPGLAIVISDFLFPLEQAEDWFRVLSQKNLEIVFIQVLGNADLNPNFSNKIIDSENNQIIEIDFSKKDVLRYSNELNAHNQLLRQFCASKNVHYAYYQESNDIFDFLTKELGKLGLIQ